MSEIRIDSEAMQAVVSKAVLEGIDAAQRDTLIEQAVKHLITPTRGQYGAVGPTPLQEAFDQAIDRTILGVTIELVERNEPLQARIRELIDKTIADVMREDDSGLAEAVRAGVGSAISNYRDRY